MLAITTADVQRIAVEYLRPEEMTIAIVGDASAIAEEIDEAQQRDRRRLQRYQEAADRKSWKRFTEFLTETLTR